MPGVPWQGGVRNRRVNERTGKEVELDDIVKGYDIGCEYVLVEPKELAEVAPGRSQAMEITGFGVRRWSPSKESRPAALGGLAGGAHGGGRPPFPARRAQASPVWERVL